MGRVGAFERRRYMNIVVQKARHAQLREYIHSAVTGLLPFVEKVLTNVNSDIRAPLSISTAMHNVSFPKGMVERVAVIFFNTENLPLERFIFKLSVNQSYGTKVEDTDLEFSLRSFFIKLPVSEPLTKALPRDCRWEIMAYFRSLPESIASKDADLWIPTDTQQWLQPPLIIPIKSMSSEPLCVQLYVEHPSLSEPKP
ncbi:hypothetical protein U1Q18_023878 [Sarracenia purpurea var. burkii]